MSNIIDFEKLAERIKENNIENSKNLLLMGGVLQAFIDLSQEINAITKFCYNWDFTPDKIKKALQQYANINGNITIYAISDLLELHGNSMANFSKFIPQTVDLPKNINSHYFEIEKAEIKETIAKEYLQTHTPIITNYQNYLIETLKKDTENNKGNNLN